MSYWIYPLSLFSFVFIFYFFFFPFLFLTTISLSSLSSPLKKSRSVWLLARFTSGHPCKKRKKKKVFGKATGSFHMPLGAILLVFF